MPSAWTQLRGAVDPIARRYGQYTAYGLAPAEYIGSAGPEFSLDWCRTFLTSRHYEPQYLSAAKKHPGTGQLHDLSYRRVPSSHPPLAADRRLGADFFPQECQYHVHVFETDDGAEFFSHYEARPDFTSPWLSLVRLQTHYRPTYGQTYLRGVTDLDVLQLPR